jgi:hypothetical protein
MYPLGRSEPFERNAKGSVVLGAIFDKYADIEYRKTEHGPMLAAKITANVPVLNEIVDEIFGSMGN